MAGRKSDMTKKVIQPKKVEIEDKRASVFYKLGVTKSLGNYETVRIDYGITMPCKEADIDKVTKQVVKKVSDFVAKELKGLGHDA